MLLFPTLERNSLGFVGISLATKNGFISRALLGGQNLEQKEKLWKELDKCSLWSTTQHICSLTLHLLPPGSPTPKRILSELTRLWSSLKEKFIPYVECFIRSFEGVLSSGITDKKDKWAIPCKLGSICRFYCFPISLSTGHLSRVALWKGHAMGGNFSWSSSEREGLPTVPSSLLWLVYLPQQNLMTLSITSRASWFSACHH